MDDIRKTFEELPSDKRQLVEKLISQSKEDQDPDKESRNICSGEEKLISYYKSLDLDQRTEREYARFAPFENIVNGFSWIEFLFNPQKDPEISELYLNAQDKMKSVLFRGIDFSSIEKVIDVGCGYSSDLIALAEKYPHIQFHGYNISPEQIETGNQKVKTRGHSQRINLYIRNSAEEPFLDNYDLVFSFQVIHHIKEKEDIFLNIGQHLRNGGFFVAAEIFSNLPLTPIEDLKSTAYFSTIFKWAELLSRNNLRVVEAVDASLEIANFLYDPNFTENFTKLTKDYDDVTKEHLTGPHKLGELLRKGLTAYILLTAQKDRHVKKETLLRLNKEKLSSLMPYSKLIEASKDKEPVLLPNLTLEELDPKIVFGRSGQNSSPFLARIGSQEPEQRKLMLESYFKAQIANILCLPESEIEVPQPLNEMGLDSLMAVELRNRVQTELAVDVPIVKFLEDISIVGLVTEVNGQLTQLDKNQGTAQENNEQLLLTDVKAGDWIEGEL